jgi:hypothetical protein
MFRRFVVLLGIIFSAQSYALIIEYDLTQLSATQYQYNYTFTNDGSIASNIELFSINFDPALYDESSLTLNASADVTANWDIQILSSALLIPAALDFFALGSGLATGESFTGVSIDFEWIGVASLPGVQSFDVFDAATFDFIGSGETFAATTSNPVSAPGTLLLLIPSLYYCFRRRSARQ